MAVFAAIFWRTLLSNPWGVQGNLDQRLELGTRHLRGDLIDCYKQQPGIAANEHIRDITLGMLGKRKHADENIPHPGGELKLKAAECGVVLLFACHLLETRGDDIYGRGSLRLAAQALLQTLRWHAKLSAQIIV